jgi:hypothetical protein
MVPKVAKTTKSGAAASENIAYIWQMLGELRQVAENEGADLLCYLIEMAYVEAGELQTGRAMSVGHGKRN